jgi:ribosomal protein S18 acetylase RimI-like enzyme
MPAIKGDPISGTWETNRGEYIELAFDGQLGVSGMITAGGRGNLADIRSGTFNPETGDLRLEGSAKRPGTGAPVEFVIEGTLRKRALRVTYRFDGDRGAAILRRVTRWTPLRRGLREAGQWTIQRAGRMSRPVIRYLLARRRPSKATNMRLLRQRGESSSSFVFRDATAHDIPGLAAVHATAWSATYPFVRRPPSFSLREGQWREAFAEPEGTWFCIVIEKATGELIGFAKGIPNENGSGDLNKIYLLTDYQRLGLGRKLVGHVARRFLAHGISSMTLSADPANPSCRFYEALGAETNGDGAYVWRDLRRLASVCPVE